MNLIKKFVKTFEEYKDAVAYIFMNIMIKRHDIIHYENDIAYKDGRIIVRYKFYTRKEKNREQNEIIETYENGKRTTEKTKFADYFSKLEKEVLTNYFPLFAVLDVSLEILYQILDSYWNKNNKTFIFKEYEKINKTYYIYFSLEGFEDYTFEVRYSRIEKRFEITRICSVTIGNLYNIFDEEDILHFITEEAPCRLEILFD